MKKDYYTDFMEMSDVQILDALYKINGYNEEAQLQLKEVGIKKGLINNETEFQVDNFNEAQLEYYERIVHKVYERNLIKAVPLKFRFFHLLVDYVGLYYFVYVLIAFLTPFDYDQLILGMPDWVIQIGVYFSYFFLQELLWGKTLGKFLTKTKVVNLQNGKPSTHQIFIRSICRFIPFEQFSYLGDKPIGFHDSVSRTYVVFDNE